MRRSERLAGARRGTEATPCGAGIGRYVFGRGGRRMQGEVHDPWSYRLGGIAGHAGLFSTAEDLAVFAQMMLGRGEYGGARILDEDAVMRMIRPNDVAGRLWGLAWDMGIVVNHSTLYGNDDIGRLTLPVRPERTTVCNAGFQVIEEVETRVDVTTGN